MATIGMSRLAGSALRWSQRSFPKRDKASEVKAKTARLLPIELPEPEEKREWWWDWEGWCDDGCMCADCTMDRDPDGLMNYGAPPERQPDCDLPDCPMCFAARKWLPEKDGKTLEQWRLERERVTP